MSDCAEIAAPEPVFAEPWHAQVFAVTVALNEAGRFAWSEWAAESIPPGSGQDPYRRVRMNRNVTQNLRLAQAFA